MFNPGPSYDFGSSCRCCRYWFEQARGRNRNGNAVGSHDRCVDNEIGAHGGNHNLCHRRYWWSASQRRSQHGCFVGSDRIGTNPGCGGQCRDQIDSGYTAHHRSLGNQQCADSRMANGRIPGVLFSLFWDTLSGSSRHRGNYSTCLLGRTSAPIAARHVGGRPKQRLCGCKCRKSNPGSAGRGRKTQHSWPRRDAVHTKNCRGKDGGR
mmetsp:Transcript_19907/g.43256  ORF Transcript_19907/g.43256 Transcript_19907/m.43256 type:complete len:208 (+) Transcript_19907:645-1268(+)